MGRFQRHHLEWVSRNRTRSPRYQPVGALMQAVADTLRRPPDAELAELASVLPDIVDEDFCRCCRVSRLSRGILEFHVVERGMIYPLRLQWARVIVAELRKAWRGRSISRVVFKPGNRGEVIQRRG